MVERGEWDRTPPAPLLSPDVITSTADRYREAYRRVVGQDLWEG